MSPRTVPILELAPQGWEPESAEFRAAATATALGGWGLAGEEDGAYGDGEALLLQVTDRSGRWGLQVQALQSSCTFSGTTDEIVVGLAQWLIENHPMHPRSVGTAAVLGISIEDAIASLTELVEQLRNQLLERDATITDLRAHVEQLEAVERALRAELTKRSGPNPSSAGPLAKGAAAVVLAITSGLAGGYAQAKATPMPRLEITDRSQVARERCEVVVIVASGMADVPRKEH